MDMVLDMAEVTTKGRITIPAEVRRALGAEEGDKILFIQHDDETISLFSSTMQALKAAQHAFADAAEEANLTGPEDVVEFIREARAGR